MVAADESQSLAPKAPCDPTVAGIHLAGPNARKSALVLLEITESSTSFLSLYEKIGSSGSLFSDERILGILKSQAGLVDVVVDCPITEPPCVSCDRPVCPGVVHCDDVAVAMMLAIEQGRGRKGAHKLRPLNPQNQRLWDVMYARSGQWGSLEPSYSANLAPLVVRAKTLQRRLRACYSALSLRETNVPILLAQLSLLFDGEDWPSLYRNFEKGLATRKSILRVLSGVSAENLQIEIEASELDHLASSVETFHAFMAAAVAAWRLKGLTMSPASFFERTPGWVEILRTEQTSRSEKQDAIRMSLRCKSKASDPGQLKRRVEAARGVRDPDLVIRQVSWLDVFSGQWQLGDVAVLEGVIVGIGDSYAGSNVVDGRGLFLVPGFIDSHVHIESSMMTPDRFAESVLPRGTTTAIWDPHEIANVKGPAGIDWALDCAERSVLDIFVMIPSCVPSTSPDLELETSGAVLNAAAIEGYKAHPHVAGLAEMMNWPGLLAGDSEVLAKLHEYQNLSRDGHCPGLSGKELNAYATAGIHSCHESTQLAEAREKLSKGIHVLIREGSCAKDADTLIPILDARSSLHIGLCSDDRNPLDIEEAGHIDCIVNKALATGVDPIDAFRAASSSAAMMYGLGDRGAIAPGYLADMVLLAPRSRQSWSAGVEIHSVFKAGKPVSQLLRESSAKQLEAKTPFPGKNLNVASARFSEADFRISSPQSRVHCRVIGVRPRQIITDEVIIPMHSRTGEICADLSLDVLKISVIERHHNTRRRGLGMVQGFKIKSGAIATSINHDCHNIIVTGSSDQLMAQAVNELCDMDGGIIVVTGDGIVERLPLPIGGLMTSESPEVVSRALRRLKAAAKSIGCELEEPFLQLSFLALPVIPSLKITDRGLVSGKLFKVVSLIEESVDV